MSCRAHPKHAVRYGSPHAVDFHELIRRQGSQASPTWRRRRAAGESALAPKLKARTRTRRTFAPLQHLPARCRAAGAAQQHSPCAVSKTAATRGLRLLDRAILCARELLIPRAVELRMLRKHPRPHRAPRRPSHAPCDFAGAQLLFGRIQYLLHLTIILCMCIPLIGLILGLTTVVATAAGRGAAAKGCGAGLDAQWVVGHCMQSNCRL